MAGRIYGRVWHLVGFYHRGGSNQHRRLCPGVGETRPKPAASVFQRHQRIAPFMRELRVQSGGKPLRVFYAFDPRRAAILLIGGDKTGDDRFYERMTPIADALYDEYLAKLEKEKNNGR
ncbi:type II toxin-antitoxin system RelE/ParE family toxin [Rhodomicrobium lacus]|uniref:type II toxin-antitoxin system RelE/ParE family toxin n=1 Tax=Rhodomicrobium lacus TaxID=2498452 RepID=UPI00349F291A